MNSYLEWNDKLSAYFFNKENAGQSVYLYVNQKLIAQIERELGPEAGTFLDAVRDGPPWINNRQGICQRALKAFDGWRKRSLPFPPYVAYLGFFVLGGATDGEFAPHAYYPRLHKLLGEPAEGMLPSFDLMWQLWEDLEIWSVHDKQGEAGIFQARIIGRQVHIGFPLAQSMLTEQERKSLPRVFYDSGLDPAFTPPTDELARALRSSAAKSLLRPRTVRLVENPSDHELYQAMLGTVADELAEWDGEVDDSNLGGIQSKLIFAGFQLCLNLDPVAGSADVSVRCKLNREFPEEGLTIDVPGLNGRFRAEEDLEGWSLPIRDSETGEVLDASMLNWHDGVTATVTPANWRLKLRGQPVRLFVDGNTAGLPGLVETHALPQGQPFYMAYSQDSWPQLDQWVTHQCCGFHEFENVHGLPLMWRFARIEKVISDAAIRGVFRFLSFPPERRLRFVGGIRSSKGNNFFYFAPPGIIVQGGTANIEVFCYEKAKDYQPLVPSGTKEVLVLPQGLSTETQIFIEAQSGKAVLDRVSLFLTGDFSLPSCDDGLFLDNAGFNAGLNDERLSITGAHVRGHLLVQLDPKTELREDLEAEVGNVQGYLIGQTPGQVAVWPSEPFPSGWSPIWMIARKKRKQWEAVFIGGNLEIASPNLSSVESGRAVQAWKRILWYRRRRILPPALPNVRALWKQFREVARNV